VDAPGLFQTIIPEGDWTTLPEPESPYFVYGDEGHFSYRGTLIGNVLLHQYKKPESLPKIGVKEGLFNWTAPKIPDHIFSQAHHFFARIFEKHHAEAEVLITMHWETKEFRLFIPVQEVSYGGLKSIYDHTNIDKNYNVVGTLHSHCDFGAFHSGTDSGDASDMDGVHFTIGQVNRTTPEIVGMVAMNGKEFHYKDLSEIGDIQFGTKTSPEWWDTFVYANGLPAEKPKSLKSITQARWDEFRNGRGRIRKPDTKVPQLTSGAPNFNPKPTKGSWGEYRSDWEDNGDWRDLLPQSKKKWDPADLEAGIAFASEKGVIGADDWGNIEANDIDDPEFWLKFLADRSGHLHRTMSIIRGYTKP
jgi:proteasome lid subunit RPN8/RPN11